jgi:hypothetical protein
VPYDPKVFRNEKGEFDFSKAENYDQELILSNINHVKRDPSVQIIEPREI